MERDELIEKFTKHEVETAEEILKCLGGPATADKFRRMLLLFLRGHYSNADNYMGFDHLSCFVWTPGEDSRLVIDFSHTADDRKPDNYPGIYVGFGAANFTKIAIGNKAGNSQDMATTMLSKESVVTYEISHVSKNASDAYDLAELTARALTAMGGPLSYNGGANGFEVLGLRIPKEKKPSPESYYEVATPVEIKYTLAVTRTLESHRIRMIVNEIDTTTT